MAEDELIRASHRDPEAFGALFERHAVTMRRWLASQVGDVAVANDLLAETFAQAWRSRRRFAGATADTAVAWLYGIARNLLRQHYKRGRVETAARRKIGMETEAPQRDDLGQILARLDAQEFGTELQSALDRLPVSQRDAIDARVVRELSYAEVADRLRCSETNARAYVSRGLRALNAILKGVQ